MERNALIDLKAAMKEAKSKLLSEGQPTFGQFVLRCQADLSEQIEAAKEPLKDLGVRSIAHEVMKNSGVSGGSKSQFSLPIELKNVKKPTSITVPVKSNEGQDAVTYVDFENSSWDQIEAHERLLREGIEKDVASHQEWQEIMRFYKPLMSRHPARTVAEATKIFNETHKR